MVILDDNINGKDIFPDGIGITFGKFDGIHLGHRALINRLTKLCSERCIKSAVYTFKQNPKSILYNEKVGILASRDKKNKLIQSLRVNYIIYDDFDNNLWTMKPEEFFKDVLVKKYNVRLMVVGFNFRFGAGRTGDTKTLQKLGNKYGIHIEVQEPTLVQVDGHNLEVSSTIARKLIHDGDVTKVSELLSRYYSLEGTVVQGSGKGRELGYRTANLKLMENQVTPQNGGYATMTLIDGEFYNSVTYVGTRPTFDGKERSIETHLINQDLDLYDKNIEVYFVDKVSIDKKFDSPQDLTTYIKQAVQVAEEKLKSINFSKLI